MGEAERTLAARADTRQVKGRVTIDWTDPYRDLSIIATANQNNYTSYPANVANNISTVPFKTFYLDGVSPLSDGNGLAPGTFDETLDSEMGWWGSTFCDGSGNFSTPYPQIEVSYSPRPVLFFTVAGDDKWNEYPVDFTVSFYDEFNVLLYTEVVTGNSQVVYTSDISSQNVDNCVRAMLTITKWSQPNAVLKISEFFSSVVITYDGEDVISFDILEETEIKNGSLPIGNISANECNLALQNVDDEYFPDNTGSIFNDLIGVNKKITLEIGWLLSTGLVEYVTMGTFWSADWKMKELGVDATTSARDRMELLRNSNYVPTDVFENYTLYQLLEEVLETARLEIRDLTYTIDTELQGADFIVPLAVFERKSYFETIRRICAAGLAFSYVSRNDVITIIGPTAAGAVQTTPYKITKNEYFDQTRPANTEEIKNVIEVTFNPMIRANAATRVYKSKEGIIATAGESGTTQVKYSLNKTEKAVFDAQAFLVNTDSDPETTATNVSITSVVYYSFGADISWEATGNADFQIAVNGKLVSVDGEETVVARDETSIRYYGEKLFELKENLLVQTRSLANKITSELLSVYSQPRKDIDVNWVGDTALRLAENFEIPTYQKNGIDNRAEFKVTRNKIEFDGSLRYKTKGRKIRDLITEDIQKYQDDDSATTLWQDTDASTDKKQDTDE